jgi:hypothetical protein
MIFNNNELFKKKIEFKVNMSIFIFNLHIFVEIVFLSPECEEFLYIEIVFRTD